MGTSHSLADVCHCPSFSLREFEATLLHQTMLRETGLGGIDYRGHRKRISTAFALFGASPDTPSPHYVFAHVFAPHPPFVLAEDGDSRHPRRLFSINDGNAFRGSEQEYRSGYRAQATYISEMVIQVVDRIIANSFTRQRDPVIILHGDHGPRLEWDLADARNTDASEALPVLLAIRWAPSSTRAEHPRSLVNVYRAFFRRYLNSAVPLLPDKGFLSSFSRPYDLLEVNLQRLHDR